MEVEIPIRRDSFRSLWRLTQGRRLEKTRYRLPFGALVIELDVYRGKLRGLVTAEVEFASDRHYRKFQPPGWFGKEVTGQARYSNSQLAANPRSPKPHEGARWRSS